MIIGDGNGCFVQADQQISAITDTIYINREKANADAQYYQVR